MKRTKQRDSMLVRVLIGVLVVGSLMAQEVKVFTLPREKPWRMVDDPAAVDAPAQPAFTGVAQPGEFYVFQIVVASRAAIGPLNLRMSALKGDKGEIPADNQRCISLGGINPEGQPFTKDIYVKAGEAQALWVGVDVPETVRGVYSGRAVLEAGTRGDIPVDIRLTVQGEVLHDHGESDSWRLARLRWLDSTVGSEPAVTKPFKSVETHSRTVRVLGRELVLGEDGLPAEIRSFFNTSNTEIKKTSRPVLAGPFEFSVETGGGFVQWKKRFGRLEHDDLEARWAAGLVGDGLQAEVAGDLDYTGSGSIRITLTAQRDLDLKDVHLEIPWAESAATYSMGLNRRGGLREDNPLDWKWEPEKKQQDCLWMGDVNAGMMVRLKGRNYRWPLVNIYYKFCPLLMPGSWGNNGKGGIQVSSARDGRVVLRAYSGTRSLKAGEMLDFIADFYLTPFRPIDTEKQWSVRFDHPHSNRTDPDYLNKIVAQTDPTHDANVLNIHQAHVLLPFINYPYADAYMPELKELVKKAQAKGIRVKPYYTTREVTQNMPELHALHSMNGEIIQPGPGAATRTVLHKNGPHPWLVQNLGREFIPAWADHLRRPEAEWDLSVLTTPDSRWNNFYLEGLRWMVERTGIDGVYIDDTALDARSLRRARRILDRKPGALIDFHTWNHFNGKAGYANNLNIYMELLPYFDRLWIGEGFDCNKAALDFWLVEMSGLPFGVMSEMLQNVNSWRGLVFGEVARKSWSGDPTGIWRVWDTYGLKGTEMFGWFAPDNPVKSSRREVPVTVYRGDGYALLAIASWAADYCDVTLDIDWQKLGIDEKRATLYAPEIPGFQVETAWKPGESLMVKPERGYFIVVDETLRNVDAIRPKTQDVTLTEAFRDPFSTPVLEDCWRVVTSQERGGTAQAIGGGFEVTALANVHAGIECDLPANTAAVEVEIEPQSDQSKSWGPGIALAWKNGETAKFNLRPGEKKYEVFAENQTQVLNGPYGSRSTFIRILLNEEFVRFQVRMSADERWESLAALTRKTLKGAPQLLRVGKMDQQGLWNDFGNGDGPVGTCRFKQVSVFTQE